MFVVVSPRDGSEHLPLLETMFKKRGGKDAHDTDKTIYIVYDNPTKSLFGSARINPVSESILTDVGLFDKKNCDTLGLLELSLISFEDSSPYMDPNKEIFKSWFYTGLKEVLRIFALKKNLKGFISVNTPESYQGCVEYGDFSFEEAFELPLQKENRSLYFGFLLFDEQARLFA